MKFFFLLMLTSISTSSAYSFESMDYAQDGEELCDFITDYAGGLNPASLECARGAGAGSYTSDETVFCHKLIFEKKLTPLQCLSGIDGVTTADQLNKCAQLSSSKEILKCLKN